MIRPGESGAGWAIWCWEGPILHFTCISLWDWAVGAEIGHAARSADERGKFDFLSNYLKEIWLNISVESYPTPG